MVPWHSLKQYVGNAADVGTMYTMSVLISKYIGAETMAVPENISWIQLIYTSDFQRCLRESLYNEA